MKEEYSLPEYAKVLGDAGRVDLYLPEGGLNKDKFSRLRANVTQIFMRTRGDGFSNNGIEIAVAGLCKAMEKSSGPVKDFYNSMTLTKDILYKIITFGLKYGSKNEFDYDTIRGYFHSVKRLTSTGSPSLTNNEARALVNFEGSIDIAIMQKLDENYDLNRRMPANEYMREFGGIDQEEISPLHRRFSELAFQTIDHWKEQEEEYASIPSWFFDEEIPKKEPRKKIPDWFFNPSK